MWIAIHRINSSRNNKLWLNQCRKRISSSAHWVYIHHRIHSLKYLLAATNKRHIYYILHTHFPFTLCLPSRTAPKWRAGNCTVSHSPWCGLAKCWAPRWKRKRSMYQIMFRGVKLVAAAVYFIRVVWSIVVKCDWFSFQECKNDIKYSIFKVTIHTYFWK